MAGISEALDFSGRRVLVTGGGRGLGKAIAKTFLRQNATVFVIDRRQDLLDLLNKEEPDIVTLRVDLTDWEEVEKVVSTVLPVHHLVNNAGIAGRPSYLLDMTEMDMDLIHGVNTKAVVRVSQLVARGMINNKIEGGTIVNISSLVSDNVVDGLMVYGASKAGIVYMTKSMANELAKYKIRVNCIRPALIRTEMAMEMPEERKQKVFGANLERQIYHQDFLEPENVANGVVYFSSRLSEMITGTSLCIDAGYEAT